MFEFPSRHHFGLYYVIWLSLLLSNNFLFFVHKFPMEIVEIKAETTKRHTIQNGGTDNVQILD